MPTNARPTQPRAMTTQERRVLELLASGMSQAAVARQLNISRQRVNQIVEALRSRGVT